MLVSRHVSFELDAARTQLPKREFMSDFSVAIALAALLTYDVVIMLDKEVKHFWKHTRLDITGSYFMSRYGGLVSLAFGLSIYSTNGDDLSCVIFENIQGVFELMIILSVDYILLLRVQALYFGSRKMRILLRILFTAEALSGIALYIQGNVASHTESTTIATGFSQCSRNAPDTVVGPISWAIPLAYNVIVMAIALYQARIVWMESGGFKGFNLMYILIRDQAVYFVAVIFGSVMHVVGAEIVDNVFVSYVIQLIGAPALLSVVGPRLLINMREAGEKGVNCGSNYYEMSLVVSEIEFV